MCDPLSVGYIMAAMHMVLYSGFHSQTEVLS